MLRWSRAVAHYRVVEFPENLVRWHVVQCNDYGCIGRSEFLLKPNPKETTDLLRIIMSLMPNRLSIASPALLAGFLLASCLIATVPACAQGDAFAQRFDAVLSQHGVVGGGIGAPIGFYRDSVVGGRRES